MYQIDLQISYRDWKLIFLQSRGSKPRSSVELTHASHATAVAAVAAFLDAQLVNGGGRSVWYPRGTNGYRKDRTGRIGWTSILGGWPFIYVGRYGISTEQRMQQRSTNVIYRNITNKNGWYQTWTMAGWWFRAPQKHTSNNLGDNITHKSDIKQKDMGANLGDVYLCCIIQS